MFSSAWQRGTTIDRPQGTNSVVQFHFPNCMFIYFRTSVCSDKIVSIGKTVSPRMNHSFGSPWFWPIAGRLTFSKDQLISQTFVNWFIRFLSLCKALSKSQFAYIICQHWSNPNSLPSKCAINRTQYMHDMSIILMSDEPASYKA